jgi:hypothetical protein
MMMMRRRGTLFLVEKRHWMNGRPTHAAEDSFNLRRSIGPVERIQMAGARNKGAVSDSSDDHSLQDHNTIMVVSI